MLPAECDRYHGKSSRTASESILGVITRTVPPQELHEVRRLLGSDSVAALEDLHQELDSLKQVYSDCLPIPVNTDNLNSSGFERGALVQRIGMLVNDLTQTEQSTLLISEAEQALVNQVLYELRQKKSSSRRNLAKPNGCDIVPISWNGVVTYEKLQQSEDVLFAMRDVLALEKSQVARSIDDMRERMETVLSSKRMAVWEENKCVPLIPLRELANKLEGRQRERERMSQLETLFGGKMTEQSRPASYPLQSPKHEKNRQERTSASAPVKTLTADAELAELFAEFAELERPLTRGSVQLDIGAPTVPDSPSSPSKPLAGDTSIPSRDGSAKGLRRNPRKPEPPPSSPRQARASAVRPRPPQARPPTALDRSKPQPVPPIRLRRLIRRDSAPTGVPMPQPIPVESTHLS
ncbi:hypothetical protein BC832DRAFT_561326 [Gaertneriomyces semiglobifer]|nr:hypothetical protein BC832DRAFT_561326 [Gaertneriomyces semiglobifer]